ncbi:MAG TPA: magnesium/cobalt transporter CorA [Bacteroidia bacterium]|nr:MAG: cation transporter [Bacteroidetes bacterium OLB10]MBV6454001.1 Cobalt/magnesium transport protein CorA [Bacteroidia bacterium]MBX3105047.1 magnesium/cobalt transporter CorA [Bacteroidota bacterium]MCB0849216.1 magnesium/cobalt transporter CorA [Bacteroidota bacterium]MCB8929925.1 magnesium/cobalt transporter CorA [Bacteroidia bacterium]
MAKYKRLRVKLSRKKHTQPGSQPGSFNIPADALSPVAHAIVYSAESFEEKQECTIEEIEKIYTSLNGKMLWLHISGFGNRDFFEKITSVFHFHRLEMEDVFNVYQRPKLDEYEGHLFFTSRMLSMNNGELSNDQLSLMLGSNFVITIQEKRQDFFEPVRLRLRNSKGTIRSLKSDYIAYALMDAIVDFYYPALEEIGIKLDDLEEELLSKPTSESLNKILQIKRELIVFKRAIWPERDKINDVIRSSFDEIHEDTKVYFRDSYDHCIQILDIVESYKEVTSSLMDVYLSSVSNKLNQVMKVLTIISTIFIPLTFIVGLYGMNFQGTNPTTGDKLPLNMPELYSPYGYVGVIVVMILIVAIQLYIFHRKGWIRFREN